MKFKLQDRVRIVSAASQFFGWTGDVTGTYDEVFMTGEKHYHVCLDGFKGARTELRDHQVVFTGEAAEIPALLFNERELAFSS